MLDAKKIILIQENASAKRGSSQIDEATYKQQHTGCIVLTQNKKILLYSNQFVFRQGGK
ncbi:MAG TPA: hypothetical protein VJ205_02505 [Gammaproteobacteria bacterium]|nr:hypothetical protein [Gammaproteobacteria bacterium]